MARLFVYGSLKRGQANHHELGPAELLGEVRTAPAFALRAIEGYPALVPGQRAIAGELYVVSDFAPLDEFEGDGYVRREIVLADGGRAEAYFAREPAAGIALDCDVWPM